MLVLKNRQKAAQLAGEQYVFAEAKLLEFEQLVVSQLAGLVAKLECPSLALFLGHRGNPEDDTEAAGLPN